MASEKTIDCFVFPISVPSQSCYIANGSSNPTRLRPKRVPPKVFAAHYDLVPLELAKKFTLPESPPMGPSFTKSSLPAFESFMPGNGNKKYVFILVPNSIAAPFGAPGTVIGAITDVTAAVIEDIPNGTGAWWLSRLTDYNPALGPAIDANKEAVDNLLPTAPAGCTISIIPYVTAVALTDDEEEGAEFGPAVEELKAKLASHDPNAQAPEAEDATILSNVVISETAPASTPEPPAPPKVDKDAEELNDILLRFRLLLSRIENGTVVLGTVDPDLEQILRKATKSNRAKALMSFIITKMKRTGESYDHLLRRINWKGITELAVAGMVLGCQFNADPFVSVEELTSQQQQMGLTPCHFTRIPKKQLEEVVKKSQHANATRNLEDWMGVAPDDPSRTKPVTTVYANANITSAEALLTCGSNLIFLFLALGDFDLRSDTVSKELRSENAPAFIKAMFNLCDESSTAEFLSYLSTHVDQAKFCYYVFNQYGSLFRSIMEFATDNCNLLTAQSAATVNLLPTHHLQQIETLTTIALNQLILFKNGSGAIPSTALYESSPQRKAERKRELLDLGFEVSSTKRPKPQPTPTKPSPLTPTPRRTPGTPATPGAKTGIIKCTDNRVPEPTIRNAKNVQNLCVMNIRDGTTCPWGAACNRSHAPIDQWEATLVEDWSNHVKATNCLEWNADAIPSTMFNKLGLS